MYVLIVVYLLLVLIRPQDYPDFVAEDAIPWQQIALVGAGLIWALSPRKSFAAPQYALIGVFLLVLMFSSIVNGWMGGALVQLTKFAPAVIAFCVLSNAMTSPKRVHRTMAVFVLCAVVLAAHGIEQVAAGVGWTGIELSQSMVDQLRAKPTVGQTLGHESTVEGHGMAARAPHRRNPVPRPLHREIL